MRQLTDAEWKELGRLMLGPHLHPHPEHMSFRVAEPFKYVDVRLTRRRPSGAVALEVLKHRGFTSDHDRASGYRDRAETWARQWVSVRIADMLGITGSPESPAWMRG